MHILLAYQLLLILLSILLCCSQSQEKNDSFTSSNYKDLVTLFKEWRDFQKPEINNGVPDYTAAAMEKQQQGLKEQQAKLAAIDPSSWPISQQVDYHIVRAEMNGLNFDFRILKPWSRNPCFYAVLYTSPSDLPALEGPWK